MKKLVIVADDFGMLPCVNNGIKYLYETGLTFETSLLTDSKHTKDAIEIINEINMQNIGIHIELLGNSYLNRPVTSNDYIKLYKEKSYEDIEKLTKEEFDRFEKLLNRPPTHITSHKGIHGNFKLLNFIVEYAKEKNIPIRKPITALGVELANENYAAEIVIKRANLKTTNYLFAHMLDNNMNQIKNKYMTDLNNIKDNENAEIAIHPSFFDEKLLKTSALNYHRTRDLILFSDQSFLNQIKDLGFTICNYKKI